MKTTFALIALASALGLFTASAFAGLIAREGVTTTDNRHFKINMPADTSYDAGGFLLASNSDADGICSGFGYGRSVPGSLSIAERAEGRRALVDYTGFARGIVVSALFVRSVICTRAPSYESPASLSARNGAVSVGANIRRYNLPVDAGVDATTTIQISASSDADGVCRGLGQRRSVPNGVRFEQSARAGRRSVIGHDGQRRMVSVEALYISSIDCSGR